MSWDEHDPLGGRRRTVFAGLAVALALGVIVAIAVAFLNVDFVDSSGEAATNPTVSIPGTTPTTEPTSEPPESSPTTKKTKPTPRDVLNAPSTVTANARIDLTGQFTGLGPGVFLQVERKEGGVWTAFPVTMSTNSGGSFATWVITGHTGPNIFRVSAPDLGRSTNPVTVQVT